MKKGMKLAVLSSAFAVGIGVFGGTGQAFAYSDLFQQPDVKSYSTYEEYAKAVQHEVSIAWEQARDQYELDRIVQQETDNLAEAKTYYEQQPKQDTVDQQLANRNAMAEKIAYAESHNYSNFASYDEFVKAVNVVVSYDWQNARDQWELDDICDWEAKVLAGAKAHFGVTETTTPPTTTTPPPTTTTPPTTASERTFDPTITVKPSDFTNYNSFEKAVNAEVTEMLQSVQGEDGWVDKWTQIYDAERDALAKGKAYFDQKVTTTSVKTPVVKKSVKKASTVKTLSATKPALVKVATATPYKKGVTTIKPYVKQKYCLVKKAKSIS